MAISGEGHLLGRRPAAYFYPFGQSTPMITSVFYSLAPDKLFISSIKKISEQERKRLDRSEL
jgi:hypothetical protein